MHEAIKFKSTCKCVSYILNSSNRSVFFFFFFRVCWRWRKLDSVDMNVNAISGHEFNKIPLSSKDVCFSHPSACGLVSGYVTSLLQGNAWVRLMIIKST